MSGNVQKTPVGLSLNSFARNKALDQIARTGRSLPCTVVKVSGAIVTVAFQIQAAPGQAAATLPNVTMPVLGTEYIRAPIQVGCKGLAIAADAYLGGVSGIGGGVATMAQPANLTALVFVPIGNSGWFSVNGNVLVMYGPQGVTLMDQGMACVFTLTPTGATLALGAIDIKLSSAGIELDGNVVIDGNLQVNGNINATGTISP
jgi:hypothetical protein